MELLASMTQKSLAELRKAVNQAYLADEKQRGKV
jgi:hypothetical protein